MKASWSLNRARLRWLLWQLLLWFGVTEGAGGPIRPPLPNPYRYGTGNLTFSPDGRRLLIATGADALFSREITKNNEPLDELVLRAQVLSGHRIDSTGGTLALDSLSLSNTWRSLQDPGTARAAR